MLSVLRARSGVSVPAMVARGEALPFGDGSFDVVTCATAWHWIDANAGPAEVRRVLRVGGTLALWWAFGGHGADPESAAREQAVYAKWRVGERVPLMHEPSTLDPIEALPERGFADVVAHEFNETRVVSVREHIGHLSTHSPVLALREDLDPFRDELLAAYAGQETVAENIYCRLVLARRT